VIKLRIFYYITFFLLGILGIPLIISFLNVLQHRDFIINHTEYVKKYIEIDSFYINHSKAVSKVAYFRGYSKTLDNYSTAIEFGTLDWEDFNSYIEKKEGKNFSYIWYRKGAKYAYPGKETEKKVPITSYLMKQLIFFIYWLFLLIINRFCKYIIKRKIKE